MPFTLLCSGIFLYKVTEYLSRAHFICDKFYYFYNRLINVTPSLAKMFKIVENFFRG